MPSTIMRRTACSSAAAVLILLAPSASAQDNADGEAAPRSRNRTIIGAGAAITPGYQGSDDFRVLPLPAVDIVRGRLFFNLRDGLGVDLVQDSIITVGTSVNFLPGYRHRDVPQGLDRLSNAAGLRGFARASLSGLVATLGMTQSVGGGTRGLIADGSLTYPVRVSSRLMLVPSASTTWANRRHNDRYFGITSDEAFASGLRSYSLGSGMKDVSAGVAGIYQLTPRINATASVTATHLLGATADSPMVVHKMRPSTFMSLGYRF